MPQPIKPSTPPRAGATPSQLLAKIPCRPLTPEQQLAALQKVQQQADERVKLGRRLFEAAEARLERHQDLLGQIRKEQDKLREQMQGDVASSLQSYDQWMGRIDEDFTRAIDALGDRMDQMEREMAGSRGSMEQMLAQTGELLEQTQRLLAETPGTVDPSPTPPATASSQDTPTAQHKAQSIPPAPMPNPADRQPDDGQADVFSQVLDQLRGISDEAGAA